jgi:hypothetical protein
MLIGLLYTKTVNKATKNVRHFYLSVKTNILTKYLLFDIIP